MGRRPYVYPHLNFFKNLSEVHRLLEIHEKHRVEVLNKSAIVLLVACWETFVEDLAGSAFSILLERAKTHRWIPRKVRAEAAKPLRISKNPCDVWKLADGGWKNVLRTHKAGLFKEYIGNLHSPRPSNVNSLYESLLGIRSVSNSWHWQRMRTDQAVAKLEELITLRGSIAHRVAAKRKVFKGDVTKYIDFINRIAVQTSNEVRKFLLKSTTGKEPWGEFSYKPIRKSQQKDVDT